MTHNYTIKTLDFERDDFTAYESIMLASNLTKVITKFTGNKSMFDAIGELDGEEIIRLLKMVLVKTKHKKIYIDLDSSYWAGKNLKVLYELVVKIINDEYSDFLAEVGLEEIL